MDGGRFEAAAGHAQRDATLDGSEDLGDRAGVARDVDHAEALADDLDLTVVGEGGGERPAQELQVPHEVVAGLPLPHGQRAAARPHDEVAGPV